jgi:hypothetical protein
MSIERIAIWAGVALTLAAAIPALPAQQRRPIQLRISDLPGTYELVERVLANGKVVHPPEIAGLYTWGHERANLNLFIRKADGTLASESSIIRYSLSERQYCEWIEYTARKDLDMPGFTNEAPAVASHCTPIKEDHNKLVFSPPGESVTTIYDRKGFTAIIPGQFTDHWRKID